MRPLFALALLALLAPFAFAQAPTTVGDVVVQHFATTIEVSQTQAGGAWTFQLSNRANDTRHVQVAVTETDGATFPDESFTVNLSALANFTQGLDYSASRSSATRSLAFSATVTVSAVTNGTIGPVLGTETLVVSPAIPAGPAAVPWTLIGGGVVLVAALGGAILWARKRQVRAAPRSGAMRALELERARGAQAEEIREEMKRVEAVKQASREMQILEAKRADVVKSIELLEKRREMGQITELQHRKMREKREADLAKIDAEIEEQKRKDD